MTAVKGEVQKRGERRGEAVEKRPADEASRDAARADGDEPIREGSKEPPLPAVDDDGDPRRRRDDRDPDRRE